MEGKFRHHHHCHRGDKFLKYTGTVRSPQPVDSLLVNNLTVTGSDKKEMKNSKKYDDGISNYNVFYGHENKTVTSKHRYSKCNYEIENAEVNVHIVDLNKKTTYGTVVENHSANKFSRTTKAINKQISDQNQRIDINYINLEFNARYNTDKRRVLACSKDSRAVYKNHSYYRSTDMGIGQIRYNERKTTYGKDSTGSNVCLRVIDDSKHKEVYAFRHRDGTTNYYILQDGKFSLLEPRSQLVKDCKQIEMKGDALAVDWSCDCHPTQ